MTHQSVFSFQVNQCAYSQCSCGNGVLKIGGHSIGLGPQATQDLAEVMRKIENVAVKTPSLPPSSLKDSGAFQWAENKDLSAFQKVCAN
jgi:hypothetical protein